MKKKIFHFYGPMRRGLILATAIGLSAGMALAQVQTKVSGRVVDSDGNPLPGVAVMIQGAAGGGTVTDFDGNYTINVPEGTQLKFSFVGFDNQTVTVGAGANYNVTMQDDTKELDEVIIVGYGQQKKASVVGAITQTTGEVLERAAGISDVGAALTGNLPGVITTQSSGLPGEETISIVIRGRSTTNNTDPLVLVDGVERPMSSVDMSSVANISVLKDASATAVYGVKGANGVILITTKRGAEGKAQVNVSANAILKMVSKLPGKLDSYDALMARNTAIQHELNIKRGSAEMFNSQEFIEQYRNQTTQEQKERYPNVDWQDYLFKKHAMSYNANVNVGGGTKFVKYFASADFVHEGDLFKEFESDRNYTAGFGYNKVGVRSNLDFNLTPTTLFKVNLAGNTGIQKTTYGGYSSIGDWNFAQMWAGAYNIAPDVFLPKYSDGTWGYYPSKANVTNSPQNIALGGIQKNITTRITTDFVLDQDLKMLLEGLKLNATISWDNTFVSSGFGVNDLYHNAQNTYIDPYTGEKSLSQPTEKYNGYDYAAGIKWSTDAGECKSWLTQRNLNYQIQLFYGNSFGNNNVTAMGLFKREERNQGSDIPSHREDWVFRVTYDWASKYFAEYNGAYNGSEKFSEDYRLAFFQSGAIGWAITEENFMQTLKDNKIIDYLKLRASYGEIGDDGGSPRFAYVSQWAIGGNGADGDSQGLANMGEAMGASSPYMWYRESSVGNPSVHWEVVRKFNFGLDYSFLDGLVAGSVDIFRDKRVDVYVKGADRAVPAYFGQTAASSNLGEIYNKGYEFEIRLNKSFSNGIHAWANLSYTHAENEIKAMDDAKFYPAYRKKEGYQIDQTRTFISGNFMNSYDDVYASPKYDVNDGEKLPGDYYLVDFNGDGKISSDDQAPWGYSGIPQNTYNATLGIDWRGWNFFVQFYGVSNVTREVALTSFGSQLNNVYDVGTWWSDDRAGAEVCTPRWGTEQYSTGTQNYYDGSYLRLKNAELGYTFNRVNLGQFAIKDLKLFVSGNNLWVWTKMPDDRESNFAGASNQGQYPTVKRINFGLKFSL